MYPKVGDIWHCVGNEINVIDVDPINDAVVFVYGKGWGTRMQDTRATMNLRQFRYYYAKRNTNGLP